MPKGKVMKFPLITTYTYLLAFLCCFLVLNTAEVSYAQTPSSQNSTIDLQTDANQDGLPDALVTAIQQVLTLDNPVSASDIDAAQRQAAIDAALTDLSARLPYATETRALQEHVRVLQEQLNHSQDQTQSEALLVELQKTQAEMQKDPNYTRTIHTLDTLFAPDSAIYQHEDASMTNHLFLPLVAQTTPGADATSTTVVTSANINAGPNFSALKRGHILLANGGGSFTTFLYVMNYSHSGTYDGGGYVYESNSDGVRLKPIANWQAKNKYVALGYDNMLNSYDQAWVLDRGKVKYKTDGSTSYNINFANKWSDSSVYCSQLVWKMNMFKNIDLDSNSLVYQAYIWLKWGINGNIMAIPAVAPDEVALSSYLTIYSKGTN